MTEETQTLFGAPWQIWGDGCQVRDIRGTERASCDDPEDSARITRLPELYDALKGAVREVCGTCAIMHVNPDTYDFVENGCPFSEENNACDYRDCIAILRKVRDGQ